MKKRNRKKIKPVHSPPASIPSGLAPRRQLQINLQKYLQQIFGDEARCRINVNTNGFVIEYPSDKYSYVLTDQEAIKYYIAIQRGCRKHHFELSY